MKSFLGGLCLAAGLALLDSAVAPASTLCVVFPDLAAAAAAEPVGADCVAACRSSARPASATVTDAALALTECRDTITRLWADRRAVSSAVEHRLYTPAVTGSIPVPPTHRRSAVDRRSSGKVAIAMTIDDGRAIDDGQSTMPIDDGRSTMDDGRWTTRGRSSVG